MPRPPRPLTVVLTLPFLAGCFGLRQGPVPAPTEREGTSIRGVVVQASDGSAGERIEFAEVHDVQWGERSLAIVGSLADAASPVTREWAYDDLAGVLTREVDANRTSALVSAVVIGAIATIAILMTGQTDEGTRLPGGT